MGSSPSKPTHPKEHVFKSYHYPPSLSFLAIGGLMKRSEGPIHLSPDFQSSLEDTSESNATRTSTTDLHVQQRVTSELERLLSSTESTLASVSDQLSTSPIPTSPVPDSAGLGADALAKKQAKEDALNNLSRANVQKEIDALKEKLEKRKVKEEVAGDKGVEKAKEKLVQCLRVRDRRPLDCWEEVEGFKREVGRLEGEWVKGVWER